MKLRWDFVSFWLKGLGVGAAVGIDGRGLGATVGGSDTRRLGDIVGRLGTSVGLATGFEEVGVWGNSSSVGVDVGVDVGAVDGYTVGLVVLGSRGFAVGDNVVGLKVGETV